MAKVILYNHDTSYIFDDVDIYYTSPVLKFLDKHGKFHTTSMAFDVISDNEY